MRRERTRRQFPGKATFTLAQRVRRRLGGWRQVGTPGTVLNWIRSGVELPWIRGPPPPFQGGVSMLDATPEQRRFLEYEKARLLKSGAWEECADEGYISRVFLAPKPGHTE